MTIILGIDPGVKGAFALLDTAETRVTCHDMPDTTAALLDLVMSLPAVAFCMIEKPFYPKVIGVTNVARIADAYGSVKTALAFKGISIREVRPVEWKAALNLPAAKSASRQMAGQIFPDDAAQWNLAKHDGRAESALIAWSGMRYLK